MIRQFGADFNHTSLQVMSKHIDMSNSCLFMISQFVEKFA